MTTSAAALKFNKPIQRPRPRPVLPPRRPRGRLRAISDASSSLDALLERHGRNDVEFNNRVVVPRCMTSLPQNLSELLESLLPHGY